MVFAFNERAHFIHEIVKTAKLNSFQTLENLKDICFLLRTRR